MSNRFRTTIDLPEVEPEEIVEEVIEQEEETVMTGVVANCDKLNVREQPVAGSNILCEINAGSEVIVDMDASANEFYKVFTVSGIEGFCMKNYISIQK